MQNFSEKSLLLRPSCLFVLALLLLAGFTASAQTPTLVITQMYGAGGNSGATYNADYVEIFNYGTANVALDGYAVQYASATSVSSSVTSTNISAIPAGYTLKPGQYILFQGTPGTNGTTTPNAADATLSNIAFAAAAGKVFLTSSTTAVAYGSDGCPTSTNIIDWIGYGTTANCSLGGTAAPAPSTTTADIRAAVCTNKAVNGTDFTAGTPAPHDLASTLAPCSGGGSSTTPTASVKVTASPTQATTGATVVLTATVTGTNSTNTPTGTVVFYDNTVQLGTGTSNGGGIWTYNTSNLATGANTITASYSGDTTYTTAIPATSSTPATVTISAAAITDFTVGVSNTTVILNGSQKTFTTNVPVVFGPTFTSTVTLSCSGLPSNSRCAFSPSSLSKTGNSSLTIAIDNASLQPHSSPFGKGNETILAFTLLALPFALRRKLRNRLGATGTVLGLLLFGGLLLGATGCGGNNTPAANSTVTVTATGGGVTHTAAFTLVTQ